MTAIKTTLTADQYIAQATNLMADTVISLEEQKQDEINHVLENAASLKADTVIELIQEIEIKYAY